MAEQWDGIYSAYMTGADGQGFAMLVFAGGTLTGADPLGVLFDGTYTEDNKGNLSGSVRVRVPPDEAVIQGATAGPSGITYEVPLELPLSVLNGPHFQITTPLGAVNIKLQKLR